MKTLLETVDLRKTYTVGKVAVEALQAGLSVNGQPIKYRDLSDIAGTWVEDPEFDAAIREHDRIDPEMWK